MDGKTVTIKIETVAGNTSGAKKVVADLEKEVIASQKRVAANRKATDRAILSSMTATNNAAKSQAKQQANDFIREMKRMESEAKRSATSIRGSIENALSGQFGGGLAGGAIGGFAGALVGQFASAFAQIPSILRTHLDEAVRIAAERQNAFKGLQSLSNALGIDSQATQQTVKNLRLVKSGVVEISDATIGLKNLLSAGFSLPEATRLLEAFSDTAAFGKSAALSFGEAIRGATEGIRNGNSVLVDNVGLTKNLSVILKEAGFAETDLMKVKDDMNVRQALYNGLIKEAIPQMGDANRLTQGWTGSTAALTTAQNNLYAAIGDIITRSPHLKAAIDTATQSVNDLTASFATAEDTGTKATKSLTEAFADFTIDLGISIRKEIAELQELSNFFDEVINKAASLGADLGTEWTASGAEYARRYREANARRGTFMAAADRFEAQTQSRYDVNKFRALPSTSPGDFNFGILPVKRPQRQLGDPITPIPFSEADAPRFRMLRPKGAAPSATDSDTGGGKSGGGSRRTPRVKSSKTNINLKDEMSDALDIAAKYGLVITAGSDGKHNVGSAHYDKMAIDIRTNGVSPALVAVAMQEFRDAGYYVKDERVRPKGQKEWSAAHFHVSGRNRAANASRSQRRLSPDTINRQIDDMLVAQGIYAEEGRLGDSGDLDFSRSEAEIELNKNKIEQYETLIEWQKAIGEQYQQLDEQLFNLNERSEEEIILRKIKLGQFPGMTDGQEKELIALARTVDATKAKIAADKEAKQAAEDFANEQKRIFEETSRGWENLLTDLASGNFRSVWRQMREEMLRQFIQPASQYLAQLLGNIGGMFGGMLGGQRPAMAGGMSIPGMGPGGTPMFNPNGTGGQLLGMGGGIMQNLFPGFGMSGQGPLRTDGGGISNTIGLRGGGTFTVPSMRGGIGGMLRGMGGGSMMAGIGAAGGAAASMIGGAIGGPWGNVLSLGGMGASIGANFGPWGALIGAGIGAGAGLLMMLFNRDDSIKKLKAAAASEFGISVKDKSVLKQLKEIGEGYFGKGQAGKNARAVVRTEEGMNILRAYAEETGQSGLKIDRMNYGDENWSGNQFKSKFGGFRAMGGNVQPGNWYVVGERGPETFTPTTSGTITPNGGASPEMLGALADAVYQLKDEIGKLSTKPAGVIVREGAPHAQDAIAAANNASNRANPLGAENSFRSTGTYN